jgi:poly(A) polymerase
VSAADPPSAQEVLAATLLRDSVVRELLGLLDQAGENGGVEESRIVGGALRNVLIGLDAKDIDIATTRQPGDVARIGAAAGWHVVPTGIEHGTVTFVREGRAFEITTLREDIATDGRRAQVRFGRDFRVDAARRDFTINALSMGRDGVMHDYFGGIDDLRARKVRFIGEPEARLREDYLRGLRFFRFSAAYGEGRLDPEGFAAVKAHRDGFARLSRERIRQEMMALLMARHALPVLEAAEQTGLISGILGLPVSVGRMRARLDAGDAVSALWRLRALAVHGVADVTHLRESLRLTNAEEKTLTAYCEGRAIFEASGNRDFLGLGDQFPEAGPEIIRSLAIETGNSGLLAHLGEVEMPPAFLLSGKDVLALGVEPGPNVGAILAQARGKWRAAGCPEDRAGQERLLRDCAAGNRAAD